MQPLELLRHLELDLERFRIVDPIVNTIIYYPDSGKTFINQEAVYLHKIHYHF